MKTSSVVVTYQRGSVRIAYSGKSKERARKIYLGHQSRMLYGKSRVKRVDLTVEGRWAATQTVPEGWHHRAKRTRSPG